MKKIIAFFTALSLTFCVSAPALAADNKDMASQFYDEMFAFYPWEVYSWT